MALVVSRKRSGVMDLAKTMLMVFGIIVLYIMLSGCTNNIKCNDTPYGRVCLNIN